MYRSKALAAVEAAAAGIQTTRRLGVEAVAVVDLELCLAIMQLQAEHLTQ